MATAVLGALALATAIAALSADGSSTATGRLGGDFPEFYGAGKIVREGDVPELYEASRQARSQEGLFGDDSTGYLDFAYPPIVAAAYAPLSAVSYRAAYVLHVVLMTACLWCALRLARPMVPAVRTDTAVVLAGAVAFFPMFRGISGGQNTALTLLCVVGAWRALHDDRELAAGLWFGAMLYKPQLAILVLAAPLVTRRGRVLAGAGLSAGVLWLGSALTMGVGWFGPFVRHAVSVPGGDGRVSGGGSVSLIGTAHRFDGDVGEALVVASVVCSIVVAGACLWAWRRLDAPGGDLALGLAVLAAGTVLASPHVIFYDAGILVLVGLWALRQPSPAVFRALAVLVVISAVGAFDGLPVNPLAVVSGAVLAWLLREVGRRVYVGIGARRAVSADAPSAVVTSY